MTRDYRRYTQRNPDPRFPNRPQHPDFYELSEVVQENDAQAEDRNWETRIREFCDVESLTYMATQRAARVGMKTGAIAQAEITRMAASIIDGFVLGCGFTQRKAVQAFDGELETLLATEDGELAAHDRETLERFRALIARIDEHKHMGEGS